jgi:hypothetical protein
VTEDRAARLLRLQQSSPALDHGGQAWRRGRLGAPLGNRNALQHGLTTREAKEMRSAIRDFEARTKALIEKI